MTDLTHRRKLIGVFAASIGSGALAAGVSTRYMVGSDEEESQEWVSECRSRVENRLEGYNQEFVERGMDRAIATETVVLGYHNDVLSVDVETFEEGVYADLSIYDGRAFRECLRLENAFDHMKSSVARTISKNDLSLNEVSYMIEGGKTGRITRRWDDKDVDAVLESDREDFYTG